MFYWSLHMIQRMWDGDLNIGFISFIFASLNMLIQILFSMLFGDKSVPRIGGKR